VWGEPRAGGGAIFLGRPLFPRALTSPPSPPPFSPPCTAASRRLYLFLWLTILSVLPSAILHRSYTRNPSHSSFLAYEISSDVADVSGGGGGGG
jgi:hypothetical protein